MTNSGINTQAYLEGEEMPEHSVAWFRWIYENNPKWLGGQAEALWEHYLKLEAENKELKGKKFKGHDKHCALSDPETMCNPVTAGLPCTCSEEEDEDSSKHDSKDLRPKPKTMFSKGFSCGEYETCMSDCEDCPQDEEEEDGLHNPIDHTYPPREDEDVWDDLDPIREHD